MSFDFILVPGPPVRAASWEPTATHLREAGYLVQVPDILAHQATLPAWSNWTRSLLDRLVSTDESIIVGHSSASVLATELATKLSTRGIIIVDGDIPPMQGAAAPVRPALREFIESLADDAGALPIWSRWYSGDAQRTSLVGLDILARDPIAFAQFETGLPQLSVDWFDDTIDLERWDHVPAGYIQTSQIYDHATREAQRRGWPTARLNGTHLDPTLRPSETADAILSVSRQLRRVWPLSDGGAS